MVTPPQLARPPWLFLGLLCLAVPLADSAAESPEATAAPPGRGTAAEMMEEIRSRMNNQWDALQHIRYQALLSKVAVGRLNERVKHLISTLASQEAPASERPSTSDEPCDEEEGIPALADALEELLRAYTNYVNASAEEEEEDPRSFRDDLAKIKDVVGRLRALAGAAGQAPSTRTSRSVETTPADGEPEVRREVARAGSKVVLTCPVSVAGQRVSWVRRRDNRILVVDRAVVINDARLRVAPADGNGTAGLEMANVQKIDEGRYECISSAFTPIVYYELLVVEPEVNVSVPATAPRFSNQTLTCSYNGNESIAQLKWLFNDTLFFQFDPVQNAQLRAVFNPNVQVIREASTPQRLLLRDVDVTASGRYTCQVLTAASGRVLVSSAAMAVSASPRGPRPRRLPVRMESLGDVRAAAGEGVTLSCQVFSSDEDVMVSWKRLPDRKLLSTNTYSYTSDIEHTVLHEEGRTVWHLKLAEVAGGHERFECRAIGSSGGDAADTVRLTPAEEEEVGLTAVHVPSRATRLTDQTLTCSYNLSDMSLYSVKWYLNNREFFRYSSDGQIDVFGQDVQVDTQESSATEVVLRQVDLSASGTYTCEVMTGPPAFKTYSGSSSMAVVEEKEEVGLTAVHVPSRATRLTDQTLTCSYNLGDMSPFYVNWYLNNRQFFRYSSDGQIYVFGQDVQVDTQESSATEVVLRQVDLSASGTYTCEVMAGPPAFETYFGRSSMTVVEEKEEVGLTAVHVPSRATRLTDQTLTCSYNLGDMSLYSVKWYLNEKEFFRYSSDEQIDVFGQDVQVDTQESSATEVVLRQVDLSASGTYTCEVMTDGPAFKTYSGSSSMAVVEEEEVGLTAVHVPSRATRLTDQTLTCSYNLGDMSLYSVKWYLNDREFFRYSSDGQIDVFGQDVQVDTQDSSATEVVLRQVDLSASGTYTCEVTTDAPAFRTYSGSSSMAVVEAEAQVITAEEGSSVELTCRAPRENIGQPSWIRERDEHILSVGREVYTIDARVSSEREPLSGAWTLRLDRVRPADTGGYRCLVPGSASPLTRFWLAVVEPTISMEFSDNITAESGSTAVLRCRVLNLGQGTVSWILNDEHYLTAGLFTLTADHRFTSSLEDSNVWQLRIQDVRPEDAGAYGCQVSARTPTVRTVWLDVAGASTVASTPSPAPKLCLPPFQLINNRVCIMVEIVKKRSWFDARKYCRSQGGELAKEDDDGYIRTHLEQQFGISGDTWTRWPFWLGGRTEGGASGAASADGWRWTDGSRVAAAVWAADEPRRYARKRAPQGTCLVLNGFQAYTASSLPCHLKRRFICRIV